MRVVFMMEGFAPYRVPFWNELSRHVDLTVVLLGGLEKGRKWKVDLSSVKCTLLNVNSSQLFFSAIDWAVYLSFFSVIGKLNILKPEILIIGGWSSPGYWAARWWGIRNQVPMVFWSESHALSTRTRRYGPINLIKRIFLKCFSGYYAFSPLSSSYLESFGVSWDKIVNSFNLPDIGAFPNCEKYTPDTVPVLLYVGQLIVRKGLIRLFDELALVKDCAWRLDIVGEGPLRERLIVQAEVLGFRDRVRFLGFSQPENLNNVYRSCDISLMPSFNEVWGLVLHEALLSGAFVIGSDRAAASHALIQEGINGYMCSPYEPGAFAASIRRALQRVPFDRRAIRQSVSHITIEDEVFKLYQLIRRVARNRQLTAP